MALFPSVYAAVDSIIAKFKIQAGGAPVAMAARCVVVDNNDVPVLAPDPNKTSLPLFSAQAALTALAGGAQVGATAITSAIAEFTTVATAGDSAILPISTPGMETSVINSTATSMNVFPAVGEIINALAANAAIAVAAGKTADFACVVAGKWRYLPKS